jgi:gluconolactonase
MTRCLLAVCLTALLLCPLQAQDTKTKAKGSGTKSTAGSQTKGSGSKNTAAVKTRVLKIEKKDRAGKVVSTLPLTVPTTWKDVPLTAMQKRMAMRSATVRIPAAKGDKEPGELTVFRFPSQNINDNIGRWVGQFQKDGRKQKITKGQTAKKQDYYFVEVSGTFKKADGPPMMGKTKDAPGFRMLAVILPVKGDGMYFLKLTGPDKTVMAQATAMRQTIGGNVKTEKEHKLQ